MWGLEVLGTGAGFKIQVMELKLKHEGPEGLL